MARKKTVSELLEELGACSERLRWFAKFGDNYELAWKRASKDDLAWLFRLIKRQLPKNAVGAFKLDKLCREYAGFHDQVECIPYARNLRTALPLEVVLRAMRKKIKKIKERS